MDAALSPSADQDQGAQRAVYREPVSLGPGKTRMRVNL